jgi:hypothetical protein
MMSSSTKSVRTLLLMLPFVTAEPGEHCIAGSGSSACPANAEPEKGGSAMRNTKDLGDSDVTSLLMTRLEVNQRTEAQIETQEKASKSAPSPSSPITPKVQEAKCQERGAIAVPNDVHLCMCAVGDACNSGLSMMWKIENAMFGGNIEYDCQWSEPGSADPPNCVPQPYPDPPRCEPGTILPKVSQEDGNMFFKWTTCTGCKCSDEQTTVRAVDGNKPVDMQMASLASLIYTHTPCPSNDRHMDRWTTAAGWKVAEHTTQKGRVSICLNTRENEQSGGVLQHLRNHVLNGTKSSQQAHDNFALFVNEKGNDGDGDGGVPPKTCVMSIQGTTFTGFKNWWNDQKTKKAPWCGESVHEGFKNEMMQFFGNWGIPENEELIGQPKCDPGHYTRKDYEKDMAHQMSTVLPPMAAFIKKNCDHLWTTGHSLGAALAEMFAMCWNKGGMGDTAQVSKIYTIAGPAPFAENKTEACDGKGAVKTTFPKCFGGAREYIWDDVGDADNKEPPHFDPVPIGNAIYGFMHAPYKAVQLGNEKRSATKCHDAHQESVMKKPEITPQLKEFSLGKGSSYWSKMGNAWSKKAHLVEDLMYHKTGAYMERLNPIYYEDLDQFEDADDGTSDEPPK